MLTRYYDAFVCDLAEYYGIYNYRDFRPLYLATLALGLRAESRVKTAVGGAQVPLDLLLQAIIADRLGLLFWAQTEDGVNNRNRPTSLVEVLTGKGKKDTPRKFTSPEAFKAAWAKATGEKDA